MTKDMLIQLPSATKHLKVCPLIKLRMHACIIDFTIVQIHSLIDRSPYIFRKHDYIFVLRVIDLYSIKYAGLIHSIVVLS